MERRECFGSIKEITLKDGLTMTQTRAECRDCLELRDCLRYAKQPLEERHIKPPLKEKKDKDELRRQNVIGQIIDLSQILSNEIGTCLLEFLNRACSSPLGTVFFKNLLLFYEIPRTKLSYTLTIPISPSFLDLIQEGEGYMKDLTDQSGTHQRKGSKEGFTLRLVLIQKAFANNPKANIGLIAYEVARLFSHDSHEISQVLQVLPDAEANLFKKMAPAQRISWLMEKWGFPDELKALKKEIALLGAKKGN